MLVSAHNSLYKPKDDKQSPLLAVILKENIFLLKANLFQISSPKENSNGESLKTFLLSIPKPNSNSEQSIPCEMKFFIFFSRIVVGPIIEPLIATGTKSPVFSDRSEHITFIFFFLKRQLLQLMME